MVRAGLAAVAAVGEGRLMRTVEISGKQLADLARSLAVGFGHSNPDLLVSALTPPTVSSPYCYERAFTVIPDEQYCFPVYRAFEGAAKELVAKLGELAGVTFVIVNDNAKAA
jgi:hypothetical protein